MAITFKKISGDTEVVANPTLDGSETALSGLQIDGVKYVMGGGSLYEHNLLIQYGIINNYRVMVYMTLITNSEIALTANDLATILYDNGDIIEHSVSGFYEKLDGTGTRTAIIHMSASSGRLSFTMIDGTYQSLSYSQMNDVTVTDEVRKI